MTQTPDQARAGASSARPHHAARSVGYLLAASINLVLLWLVNVDPGWRIVPWLTEDFGLVVGVVNLSLLVGVAVNLGYLATDPTWARRLGDALTAAIAVVVLLQLITVFPFDLGARAGWEPWLRVLLPLACVGSGIGVLANLAQLLRGALPVEEQHPA